MIDLIKQENIKRQNVYRWNVQEVCFEPDGDGSRQIKNRRWKQNDIQVVEIKTKQNLQTIAQ